MSRLKSFTTGKYFVLLGILNNIALIFIFFMAIWVCLEVFTRVLFNYPIPGTMELVKSLIPAIVFFSLAYTLHRKRHVYVEIIVSRFSFVGREVLILLDSLLGFLIFFIMTWYSFEPAWSGWLIREYEGVQLHIPVYPVRFICFLGSGLVSFQFLLNALASLEALLNRRRKIAA